MTRKEQIRQALKKLAAGEGPLQTLLATVKSVDEGEFTCVLEDDDVEINDVRLRPVLNGKESITILPKVGSWVLAIRIEDDADWMVIAVDEIDSYRIVVGDMLFEMKEGKFKVKSGAVNLKDILTLMIEAVQQIVVLYGNNPDYTKLTQALTKTNLLLS